MNSQRLFKEIESASGFTKSQQLKIFISLAILVISIPVTTYFGALRYQQLRIRAANYYSTLLLNPVANNPLYPGDSLSLEIYLNTGDIGGTPVEIDAADVILHYDNTKLIANHIIPGTIFGTYIGNTYGGDLDTTGIDQATGTITLSGLAFDDTSGAEQILPPFADTGLFATIDFQVKTGLTEASTSEIYFDWGLNSSTCTTGTLDERKACTTDTNVVQHETAAEVLNDAQSATLSIAVTGSEVCTPDQTRECAGEDSWGTFVGGLETCGTDDQWSGVCTRKPGDFNGDGVVNSFDLAIMFNEWNLTAPTPSVADLNNDQYVNSFDLATFWTLW